MLSRSNDPVPVFLSRTLSATNLSAATALRTSRSPPARIRPRSPYSGRSHPRWYKEWRRTSQGGGERGIAGMPYVEMWDLLWLFLEIVALSFLIYLLNELNLLFQILIFFFTSAVLSTMYSFCSEVHKSRGRILPYIAISTLYFVKNKYFSIVFYCTFLFLQAWVCFFPLACLLPLTFYICVGVVLVVGIPATMAMTDTFLSQTGKAEAESRYLPNVIISTRCGQYFDKK